MKLTNKGVVGAVSAIGLSLVAVGVVSADGSSRKADIEIFAPRNGDHVGVAERGWIVDLEVEFEDSTMLSSGSGFQLTGPAPHAAATPFPGSFSPGRDDRMPSLVVLLSTTKIGAGPGQNLANLFNVTAVSKVEGDDLYVWDTWIVGAPNFGSGSSTLLVAVVDDLNGNGILDDAPNTVADADADGDIDKDDLEHFDLASPVRSVTFSINPNPVS